MEFYVTRKIKDHKGKKEELSLCDVRLDHSERRFEIYNFKTGQLVAEGNFESIFINSVNMQITGNLDYRYDELCVYVLTHPTRKRIAA